MITSVDLSFPYCDVPRSQDVFVINKKDNRGTVWNVCCGALKAAVSVATSCPCDKKTNYD